MKRKIIIIYLLAIVILLVCWWINFSTRIPHGITGATPAVQPVVGIVGYLQLLALIIFFLSTLIIQRYPKPYLRYGILIFAILFLGFYKKTMLTTGNILNLVSGRWWPFAGHIFVYTLFLLILVSSLLGKDLYCNYCCPFGAVQQLIYKISPFKLSFNKNLISQFKKFRYFFLWIVLVVALLLDDFRIARLDPFTAMFSGKGDWLGWMQLGLILGFSLLYYRIWCYHFCPVGGVLNIIGNIPRLKKAFYKKPLSIEKINWKDMFKKSTAYIFLIVFLLLLVVTLSIIVLNLKKQVQQTFSIPPIREYSSTEQTQYSGEDFIKYGIRPRKAMYYE